MRRKRRLLSGAACFAGMALASTGMVVGAGGVAHAATPSSWVPTATKAVPLSDAIALGSVPATMPVSITVGLALRDQSTLEQFIASASNPSSSLFGDEYSPASFTAAYGPTSAQAAAVSDYLTSMGFTNVDVTSNRLLVTADGTAAEAEAAFDTVLTDYSQDGATVWANSAPLTSLPRLKSWDSRPLMLRPVGFALHRVPYVGMSLHAL